MDRSIGFEKTVQIKQFEPVRISANVENIPLEFWHDGESIGNLYKLLIIQVYKALGYAHRVEKDLADADDWREYLKVLEKELLDNLMLSSLVININVD